MYVRSVRLVNFRSYGRGEFELGRRTLVLGENGSGKSNLVEAVYLLATGKSFRAERDFEMVRYGEQFTILKSQVSMDDQIISLQVTITDRKKFEVNGVPRRMMDFVGNLRAVCFGPGDMELVTGSPSVRRRYLDFVIAQVDREYRRAAVSYEKGLRQRNRLLDLIRDGRAGRSQLFFWDKLLIKNGEYLTQKRAEFLAAMEFLYDKSVISEARLKQYEQQEVLAGSTLVGPHRDDFVLMAGGRDVSKYGSRGEQRMTVLGLKRREIEYLGGSPILLLDDIFSELDHKHREEVMKLAENYGGQAVITSADEHLIPGEKDFKVIKL
ncbi:hypothetical protein A2634_01985 [Candidatus Amesbacteria bacterium RIFCSPHIGHO2_01_FULL_48_32]|uniref:DNA replication and repair protein RecF n=1 Tax=Candidatus Amesbacteria bacterium RIFCSPLOWO2_01_FULL_48_25 TaxID=1797259 RepID=A0A1F4ZDE0_9BACT|nr:MAG: hypothetical protein A2634_01985 [Candidatus Amesbacteria bacterium RIFCSPHIGHO2_01_FULL_48_32]OGD04360.1 MAG: hypothetical protein A2989_04985 [Candidatus Amesbacteria bacterium RIFCSPLOWO2_01_FULL_48_25]HJZ06195.1 DNA replication and repair protein RecF [Patescibacteria group bacterium]